MLWDPTFWRFVGVGLGLLSLDKLIMTIWSLACTIHVLGYDLCPWGTQISKHGIFVVLSYQKISIPLINKHNVCHVWHHGCSPWPCCFWPQPYGLWSHCPWHSPNCVPMSWKWRRTIALLVACKWAQHRQMPTFYIYIYFFLSHNFGHGALLVGHNHVIFWSHGPWHPPNWYSIRVDQYVLPWHWIFLSFMFWYIGHYMMLTLRLGKDLQQHDEIPFIQSFYQRSHQSLWD